MKITDLRSLRAEKERLEYKLLIGKEKLNSDLKLLKYHLIEDALKSVNGLFKPKTNKTDQ